jgi:hypothetical protein
VIKEPNKYLKGQGALAIGPMTIGEQHVIPWLAMNWFTCVRTTKRVLYKKHLRRTQETISLWSRPGDGV